MQSAQDGNVMHVYVYGEQPSSDFALISCAISWSKLWSTNERLFHMDSIATFNENVQHL